MRKLVIVFVLLFLVVCGMFNWDLYGKWKFVDLQFLDLKIVFIDFFEVDQIKDFYLGMIFYFQFEDKVMVEVFMLLKEVENGIFEL